MTKVIAIACDTEFTTFDKIGGDVLSAAFVEILDNYTLGRESIYYFKPRSAKYFTEAAQAVHGISYFKAMTFPDPKKSCIDILHWLTPIKNYFPLDFVNHGNGKLDYRWMLETYKRADLQSSYNKAFMESRVHNTIAMAKEYLAHIPESKVINPVNQKLYTRYSLRNIADFYNIKLDHHEALSDARACAQIYCNIKLGINTFTGRLL